MQYVCTVHKHNLLRCAVVDLLECVAAATQPVLQRRMLIATQMPLLINKESSAALASARPLAQASLFGGARLVFGMEACNACVPV